MKTLAASVMLILLLLTGVNLASAQLGLVAKPEKGKPDTWIFYGVGALRMMLPSRMSMEATTLVPVKPKPYEGIVLENQSLRVMKNQDSSVILLGADESGETQLIMPLQQGKDGRFTSFSAAPPAPGTTWILPKDVWITAGDLRIKGFKIRVLTRTYDWKDPQSGKLEPVPDVLHVEFENLDYKVPGELVYLVEGGKEVKFVLSKLIGSFVFSELSNSEERLVERIGWRKIK
jgi:hypothetical protein